MRKSNFELLRIVAMFMVILSHFFVHTDFPNNGGFTLNNILINLLGIGKIGVAIFVLLSGYFLIDFKFDGKKVIRFSSQVWFYGIVILLISYLTGIGEITEKIFYRSILPFTSTNWFARVYLLLLLVYPLINYILKKISKRQVEKFILWFGIIWTILPVFSLYTIGNVRITTIYLYVIGAYIKMYGFDGIGIFKHKVSLVLNNIFMVVSSVVAITYLREANVFFCGHEDAFLAYNSVFLILISIGFFLIFKDLEMDNNKYINIISKTIFGIYLIHDNGLLRNWIWNDIFKGYIYYDSSYLFLYSIICSIMVFSICGIIDFIRIKFIEEPIFRNFDRNYEYWKAIIMTKISVVLIDSLKKYR